MSTAINDAHHHSQELRLFEVDPETLEVTADHTSALYIWSEVPGLLILQNIYFTYNPQILIDLNIFQYSSLGLR
jgi:hypothetical protein